MNLDSILGQLQASTESGPLLITEGEIFFLATEIKEVLSKEPSLLQLSAPITVCGNLQGQLPSLRKCLELGGGLSLNKFLFLGDYIDRGYNSIEVICTLFALKLKCPDRIFLLRGHQEIEAINGVYGLKDECVRKGFGITVWKALNTAFEYLPLAAQIGSQILCFHGGLGPSFNSIKEISLIKRPAKIPEEGLLCDLLWADPKEEELDFAPNDRGVSYYFGEGPVHSFCEKNNLRLIVRSHSIIDTGRSFFADKKMITIFSCTNSLSHLSGCAAIMLFDANYDYTFKPFN